MGKYLTQLEGSLDMIEAGLDGERLDPIRGINYEEQVKLAAENVKMYTVGKRMNSLYARENLQFLSGVLISVARLGENYQNFVRRCLPGFEKLEKRVEHVINSLGTR